jgi:cbb3-type cytochrome oxidase subunit 1
MKTILLFFVLLFPVAVNAGYLIKDQCLSDSVSALNAYRAQFPFIEAGVPPYYVFENVASTITTAGLITTAINYAPTSNSSTLYVGATRTIQLQSCTAEASVLQTTGTILITIACCLSGLLGFTTSKGYR